MDPKEKELVVKAKELAVKAKELGVKEKELAVKEKELAIKDKELEAKKKEIAAKEKELSVEEQIFVDIHGALHGEIERSNREAIERIKICEWVLPPKRIKGSCAPFDYCNKASYTSNNKK